MLPHRRAQGGGGRRADRRRLHGTVGAGVDGHHERTGSALTFHTRVNSDGGKKLDRKYSIENITNMSYFTKILI